ncbi:MAG: hypothetical protein K9M17_02765 [Mariprofundaceae bacterium]|nr:hypothetical protein [Mariprofundaceae bacterium]
MNIRRTLVVLSAIVISFTASGCQKTKVEAFEKFKNTSEVITATSSKIYQDSNKWRADSKTLNLLIAYDDHRNKLALDKETIKELGALRTPSAYNEWIKGVEDGHLKAIKDYNSLLSSYAGTLYSISMGVVDTKEIQDQINAINSNSQKVKGGIDKLLKKTAADSFFPKGLAIFSTAFEVYVKEHFKEEGRVVLKKVIPQNQSLIKEYSDKGKRLTVLIQLKVNAEYTSLLEDYFKVISREKSYELRLALFERVRSLNASYTSHMKSLNDMGNMYDKLPQIHANLALAFEDIAFNKKTFREFQKLGKDIADRFNELKK